MSILHARLSLCLTCDLVRLIPCVTLVLYRILIWGCVLVMGMHIIPSCVPDCLNASIVPIRHAREMLPCLKPPAYLISPRHSNVRSSFHSISRAWSSPSSASYRLPMPYPTHRASNCTILSMFVSLCTSLPSHCIPATPKSLPSSFAFHPACQKSNIPVRPLLIQHAMTTVPAPNRLATLQRNVLIAVAAFVMYGARSCVDGGSVCCGGVVVGAVGGVCGGHFCGMGWV